MADETPDDRLARLRAMVEPGQSTRDLSEADTSAIRWILTELGEERARFAWLEEQEWVTIEAYPFGPRAVRRRVQRKTQWGTASGSGHTVRDAIDDIRPGGSYD